MNFLVSSAPSASGFESLFSATASFAKRAVDANVPSQAEKNLKADIREKSREITDLETEKNTLTKLNAQLTQDVVDLSSRLQQAEAAQSKNSEDQLYADLATGKGNEPVTKNDKPVDSKPEVTKVDTTPSPAPQVDVAAGYNAAGVPDAPSADIAGINVVL